MEDNGTFHNEGGSYINGQKVDWGKYCLHKGGEDPSFYGGGGEGLSHSSSSTNNAADGPSFKEMALAGIGAFAIFKGLYEGTKAVAGYFNTTIQGLSIAAASIAVGSAITVGTYKASNYIWKKITGESSPVKSTLTTAALFASVAVVGAQCEKYPAMGVAIDAQNHRVFTSEGLLRGELNKQAMQKCQSAGGACVNLNEFRAGASGCAIYARLFDGRVAWDNIKRNPERTIQGFKERYNGQIDYGGVVCNNIAKERGMLAVARKVFEIPPTAPAAPAPGP